MNWHEQLVGQFGRQMGLELDVRVIVTPSANPATSVEDGIIVLRDESPRGRADTLHDIAHEVGHHKTGDISELARPSDSKAQLAAKASRLIIGEMRVERVVADHLPSIDATLAYRAPFPTSLQQQLFNDSALRVLQLRWVLGASALTMLGEGVLSAPRWATDLMGLAVQAHATGERARLSAALEQGFTRQELLLFLEPPRQDFTPPPPPPPPPEPEDDQSEGPPESLEDPGAPLAFGPAPDAEPIDDLEDLGTLVPSAVMPLPANAFRSASTGEFFGRYPAALAEQHLFRRAVEPQSAAVLIDGPERCQGAAGFLWDAAQVLRSTLPADRLLAVRKAMEGDRFVLRVLENPSRRQLQSFFEGESALEGALALLLAGRIAHVDELVILEGWARPWTPRALALARRLEARGTRLQRVGPRCWSGPVRSLMRVRQLTLAPAIPCVSEGGV